MMLSIMLKVHKKSGKILRDTKMITVAAEDNRSKNNLLCVLLRAGEGGKDQFPVAKITGLTGAEGSGRLGPTRTARGVGWGV